MTAPDVRAPGAVAAADRAQEQSSTDSAILSDDGAAFKLHATLAARLALLGFGLYELAGGALLVARADHTAHFSDLHGVASYLRAIEGRS